MCKGWCLALVAALGLTGVVPATPARAEEPATITLTVRDGLLSLEAREASLQAVIDEVTRRTGVRVHFDEGSAASLDDLVAIQIRDVSVEDALRLLLRGRDLVFVYGPRRLAEARVYARSQTTAAAVPPAASVSSTPTPGAPAAPAPGNAASAAPAPTASAPAAGPPLDSATLARLRSEALESPDPGVRARALERITATGDAVPTRDVAVAMLDRESNTDLLQRALDLVADDRTVPLEPVVKLALANPAPEVRVKALTHLGADADRNPRARQTLEASASNDPAPTVRDAARALLQQLASR